MTKFLTAVFQDIAQWYLNFPSWEISFLKNPRGMFSYLCFSYVYLAICY